MENSFSLFDKGNILKSDTRLHFFQIIEKAINKKIESENKKMESEKKDYKKSSNDDLITMYREN